MPARVALMRPASRARTARRPLPAGHTGRSMTSSKVRTRAPLAAMLHLVRAAADETGRGPLLPRAAREAARLLDASACEIWLTQDGLPQVAAVHMEPGADAATLDGGVLMDALGGRVLEEGAWLCVPVPGDPGPRGVLALHRPGVWRPEDVELAELVAAVAGLALALAEARRFDEGERDRFLALIGHDLRSPLANVRVGAQLARRNLAAGDRDSVEQALCIIEHQSGRLLERLQALLDAVAASGRWLIRLEALDLGALAEAVLAPFRMAAEESASGTAFEVLVEPGVARARGDAGQVTQVLEQLVDNAAKYASGGRVTVSVSGAGTAVRVDVCDDGPGIRPEEVERVFAPFGRGAAAAGKQGFGLGLYLARNIVTAHGGRLWIARTSRSGTCMALTLPVARTEET